MFKNVTADLMWGSVVRHVLQGVLGAVVMGGYMAESNVAIIMGALGSLFPFLWSLLNKEKLVTSN